MKNGKITQKDALMILIKYRPNISYHKIRKELPLNYKKDLDNTFAKIIEQELVYESSSTECYARYKLTEKGENIVKKRYAELKEKALNDLTDLVCAFGDVN